MYDIEQKRQNSTPPTRAPPFSSRSFVYGLSSTFAATRILVLPGLNTTSNKALSLHLTTKSPLFDLERLNPVCDHRAFNSSLFSNSVISVRLILSGQLTKHAVSEGKKAGSVSRSDDSFCLATSIVLEGSQSSSQPFRSRSSVPFWCAQNAIVGW